MDHDSFCTQAWTDHGERPEAVAERLPTGAALVQTPGHAAAQARLVAHVLGEHLGRWSDALAQLTPLQPLADADPVARAAVQRQRLAVAWSAGDTAALATAGLSPSEHIGTLALAASLLAGHADPDRGLAAYAAAQSAEAALPLPDTDPAVRALAANANNIAASLEERAARTPTQTAGMLVMADAALRHWARAGTWLEVERAHWRLARCHLAAGDAVAATRSAAAGLAICDNHDAPAFERFFLHVVQARAAHAVGDAAGVAEARQATLSTLAQVPADDRTWCQADLESLP
ncbi:MAG: hypothetical protein IV093_10975 [Rubrivivax sp.]|nr:hypothetical protein [Rubrivivax sp.]